MKALIYKFSCSYGRGEAPFPFRRAPGGLAMRRYRVRFHHAAAAAQSYRGSCELPASPASKAWRDALATTSRSHSRHQARTRLRVKAPRGDHCACGAASSKGSRATQDVATVMRGPTAPSHTSLPTRLPKHASRGSEFPTAPTRGC